MKIYDEMAQIRIPECLNEMTDHALRRAYKIKRRRKYIRNGILSCMLCFLTGACVLNSSYPVVARNLPFVGSAFAYIQDNLDFSGNFNSLATMVGESAHSDHLTVTMSEIYCDGSNLFISYLVESDKKFSEMAKDGYASHQIAYQADSFVDSGEGSCKLTELGAAGLEGRFLDDRTFAGSEYYVLDEREFPEEFNFRTHISEIELIAANVKDSSCIIKGDWNFSVPVRVNQSELSWIEVGKEVKEHSIDSVSVSPIMATIYTSYPDIYGDTVRYDVAVIGDRSDEEIGRIAVYGKTEGITKVPREDFDDTLSIYVVDRSIMENIGKKVPEREEFEKYAIVKAEVCLQ